MKEKKKKMKRDIPVNRQATRLMMSDKWTLKKVLQVDHLINFSKRLLKPTILVSWSMTMLLFMLLLLLSFLFPKSDKNIVHSKKYKVKYLYMYIDKNRWIAQFSSVYRTLLGFVGVLHRYSLAFDLAGRWSSTDGHMLNNLNLIAKAVTRQISIILLLFTTFKLQQARVVLAKIHRV